MAITTYHDPRLETAEADAHLLIQLRQTLHALHALGELNPAAAALAQAPDGLDFTPLAGATDFASLGLVSGTTDSRLGEVRGFNKLTPYVAGEFGVTTLDGDFVEYVLDEITYRTDTTNGETRYRFGYVDPVTAGLMSPRQVLGREEYIFHERRPTVNTIAIERNEQPLLLDFYALARATTMEEMPQVANPA